MTFSWRSLFICTLLLTLLACGAQPSVTTPEPPIGSEEPAPDTPADTPADEPPLNTPAQPLPADAIVLAAQDGEQLDGLQHTWEAVPHPNGEAHDVLQALPDLEINKEVYFQLESPQMDYEVTFNTPGLYYVWVRGYPVRGKLQTSDTLNLGLNGETLPLGYQLTGFAETGSWQQDLPDARRALLEVVEPGDYTLNAWMGKDGFAFDQLVLTREADYTPSGYLVGSDTPPPAPDPNEDPDETPPVPEPEEPDTPTPDPEPTPEPEPTPTPDPEPEPSPTPDPTPPPPAPTPDPEEGFEKHQASSAYSFLDSVGINIHLHYTDTVYKKFDSLVKPKLLKLGVKHVRDGIYTYKDANRNTFYYKRMRELGAEGIQATLISNFGEHAESTDYSKIDDVYGWLDGKVAAFEGVNEPDLTGRKDWVEKTRAAQKSLYEAVKGSAKTRSVKVIGPSVVWEAKRLGDMSKYLDYGNAHPYTGGRMPAWKAYGSSQAKVISNAARTSPGKPVMATETGYHNALNTKDTHPPTSERAAAAYLPRLLLSHYKMGIPRTFLYELLDLRADSSLGKRDMHFGLVRNDGSEKPAFAAVKNLLELLGEDAKHNPGKLAYTLSGSKDMHSLLFQKEDGSFQLALWRGVSSYDTKARKDTTVEAKEVRLELPRSTELSVHNFQADGSVKTRELSSKNLDVNLSEHVVVVEIRP